MDYCILSNKAILNWLAGRFKKIIFSDLLIPAPRVSDVKMLQVYH